ncbi:MAG TPA: carboxypeptidase-like regulatory domain-containing protein [Mucilaginibacter sp.]|jgi:hypothetical protein
MKKTILTCLIGLISVLTFAQKITVNGIVNDAQGKPVPFAFIKDAVHNHAAFSDPNGAFTFKVDTADRLLVSAPGFNKTTVTIKDPQNVSVVLAADGANGVKTAASGESFKEKLSTEGMTRNAGSEYIGKEGALHGSRYLFENWVHGYVLTSTDSIKQNDNYLFNYQKMDGSLILTEDGHTMQTINRHTIKMFVLFDDQGQYYTFENLPAIDPTHFLQLLSTGSSYKIYKQFNTKFIPNNYVSNGMTSTGNNYDEFKDDPSYYAVKVPGGTPQKFVLKSKSIKTAFAADAPKVSKYLSDHDADMDDNYITDLGNYLNW